MAFEYLSLFVSEGVSTKISLFPTFLSVGVDQPILNPCFNWLVAQFLS